MASEKWLWDSRLNVKRYRNLDTGRFLPRAKINELRDSYMTARQSDARAATQRLIDGEIDLRKWERQMRGVLKDTHGGMYVFGRGGQNAMQASDWGAVGRIVREQRGFLYGFADDLATGEYSAGKALARSAMYARAGVLSFERGKQSSYGLRLPVHPGDGGTPCLTNCLCRWEITETATQWKAIWRTASAQPCQGCVDRSNAYTSYIVEKEAPVPA